MYERSCRASLLQHILMRWVTALQISLLRIILTVLGPKYEHIENYKVKHWKLEGMYCKFKQHRRTTVSPDCTQITCW